MAKISEELDFTRETILSLHGLKYIDGWPVVYIIYGDKDAYIGETVDVGTRLMQHYKDPSRRKLKKVRVVYDEKFNKSAVLDLEAYLISHMSADGKFGKLQNKNVGHQQHNYCNKEKYKAMFPKIWRGLQQAGLARQALMNIENTNLFKFSPFSAPTKDQHAAACDIVHSIVQNVQNNKPGVYIVNGMPGTGKTVLAVYLMKLLATDVNSDKGGEIGSEDEALIKDLVKLRQMIPHPKIGLVVPMVSFRKTLQDVFKNTYGLSAKMVMGPSAVANHTGKFDILLVDEAHRLKAPRNMMGTEMANMRENNAKLGLGQNAGTQLDWILKKSRYPVLFYDEFQSIKRTDVDRKDFVALAKRAENFELDTQMRCGKGGRKYVEYVRKIFSDTPPTRFIDFQDKDQGLDYDFKMYSNVQKMVDAIKAKNAKYGLCRNVAGYAWPWKTKTKIRPTDAEQTATCIAEGKYDIEIGGNKFIWNTRRSDWVNAANAINEIGCIHTIQGYDLNYTGVIIGNDLKYDMKNDRLYIDRDEYFDVNGKNKTSDEELREYILRIYVVLCTRGIHGAYVYACDPGLREYLKRYIKIA